MVANKLTKEDMDEIKQFITDVVRSVGEELASNVATTKMEAIARAHVHEEFKALLGVDPSSTDEVRTFLDNMSFLRSFQKLSAKVGAAIILTIVVTATGGLAALVWNYIGNGSAK